jgi:ribosomal protein S6
LNKFREGNYSLTNFESSPAAIEELENNLQASQDIMRYLVTRK